MERLSVFLPADNEAGYVQAVIVGDDLPVYQKLGFVTSVDDLPKPKSTKTKAGADGSDSDKG